MVATCDEQLANPLQKFTKDFVFTAMNEKFNKDEVWGALRGKEEEEEGDYDDGSVEDEAVNSAQTDAPKKVIVVFSWTTL